MSWETVVFRSVAVPPLVACSFQEEAGLDSSFGSWKPPFCRGDVLVPAPGSSAWAVAAVGFGG